MPSPSELVFLLLTVVAAAWAIIALIIKAKHLSFANKFALGVLSIVVPLIGPLLALIVAYEKPSELIPMPQRERQKLEEYRKAKRDDGSA
ncbi:hypothetical protein GCM10028800_15670 [Nesterenkonia populi]